MLEVAARGCFGGICVGRVLYQQSTIQSPDTTYLTFFTGNAFVVKVIRVISPCSHEFFCDDFLLI